MPLRWHRLQKLEKEHAASQPPPRPFPDFEFRVAGMPMIEVRREYVRRLKAAIADPRGTNEQKMEWDASIQEMERLIASTAEWE